MLLAGIGAGFGAFALEVWLAFASDHTGVFASGDSAIGVRIYRASNAPPDWVWHLLRDSNLVSEVNFPVWLAIYLSWWWLIGTALVVACHAIPVLCRDLRRKNRA